MSAPPPHSRRAAALSHNRSPTSVHNRHPPSSQVFYNDTNLELTERLLAAAPHPSLDRCYFANSGGEVRI